MPRCLMPVLLLAACTPDAPGGLSTGPGVTSAPLPGTSSTAAPAPDTSSSSSGEDSTAAPSSTGADGETGVTDLGSPPDLGSPVPAGCQGKIDIVFSISSDNTMWNQQEKLQASFPAFIAILHDTWPDFDFHILSADTNSIWGIPWCAGCVGTCPDGPPDYPCGAEGNACDETPGAGVTFPIGWYASNERCQLYGNRRYIIASEPDPLAAFTCIASVGTSGTNAVARGALKAVSPELNAPGGCNEGFLRDDALLLVVVISDLPDYQTAGDGALWAEELIAAKGGDGDAVVLLAITGDHDDPQGVCKPFGSNNVRLREWTEHMPHGLLRSMCAETYAPFLAEAAALLEQQCDVFAPD